MKIAYLSGAYKNAGDFLIEKRALELIRHTLPEAETVRFLRSELSERKDEINRCDCVVIGGGPIYQEDLRGYMSLKTYIEEINPPTMIMGGGWYGKSGSSSAVYAYHFEEETCRFLEKVYHSGYGMSCRDPQTVSVLRNAGFPKAYMTGCPAWFDLESVESIEIRNAGEIRTIAVSDPARIRNLPSAVGVVERLRSRFPRARILFMVHRGMKQDRFTSAKTEAAYAECRRELEKSSVEICDISSGAEGFSLYDSCDLHVGFRVHAHIYNLSIRHRSVLIEEDGRGAGVNTALSLPGIRAYDDRIFVKNRMLEKVYRKLPQSINTHIPDELDTYLDILEEVDYEYLVNAFRLMRCYYKHMTDYIGQLKDGPALK